VHRSLSASTIALSSSPDHSHFLEIDAERRRIFCDIADVLVLGAAGQDLATDHQEAAVTTSLEADELAVGMIKASRILLSAIGQCLKD